MVGSMDIWLKERAYFCSDGDLLKNRYWILNFAATFVLGLTWRVANCPPHATPNHAIPYFLSCGAIDPRVAAQRAES